MVESMPVRLIILTAAQIRELAADLPPPDESEDMSLAHYRCMVHTLVHLEEGYRLSARDLKRAGADHLALLEKLEEVVRDAKYQTTPEGRRATTYPDHPEYLNLEECGVLVHQAKAGCSVSIGDGTCIARSLPLDEMCGSCQASRRLSRYYAGRERC